MRSSALASDEDYQLVHDQPLYCAATLGPLPCQLPTDHHGLHRHVTLTPSERAMAAWSDEATTAPED